MSIENTRLISTNLRGGELNIPKVDLEDFEAIRNELKKKTTEGLLNIRAKYNFRFGAVVLGGEKKLELSDSDSAYSLPCLRLDDEKTANKRVRQAFYQALKDHCTDWKDGNFPDEIKSALNLDDFAIENGEVTSEQPLTAYRISKVLDALDEYEDTPKPITLVGPNEVPAADNKVSGDKNLENAFEAIKKCAGISYETSLSELVNAFKNSFSCKNEKEMLNKMSTCFLFSHIQINDCNVESKELLLKGLMYGIYCNLKLKFCDEYGIEYFKGDGSKVGTVEKDKVRKVHEACKDSYESLQEKYHSYFSEFGNSMDFTAMDNVDEEDETDKNSLKNKILNIINP